MQVRTIFLLIVAAILLSACGSVTPVTETPTIGTLDVEIVYTGQWYRDTFNYQPDAPNIRHVVLAVPADVELAGAGWVFSGLAFALYPQPLTMQVRRQEFAPMLEYLHDAPSGSASILLAPGKYKVAVAFICEALPPPGEDVILYPGVTGGGASNEFQEV